MVRFEMKRIELLMKLPNIGFEPITRKERTPTHKSVEFYVLGNLGIIPHKRIVNFRQNWVFVWCCLSGVREGLVKFFACKPHVRFPISVLCHTNLGSDVVQERGRGYRR